MLVHVRERENVETNKEGSWRRRRQEKGSPSPAHRDQAHGESEVNNARVREGGRE